MYRGKKVVNCKTVKDDEIFKSLNEELSEIIDFFYSIIT